MNVTFGSSSKRHTGAWPRSPAIPTPGPTWWTGRTRSDRQRCCSPAFDAYLGDLPMNQPITFDVHIDQNEYLPAGGQVMDAAISVTTGGVLRPAPTAAQVIMIDCSGS